MKRWDKLNTKLLQKTRVFDLHVDRMRHPESGYEDDFYSLRVGDWANIIALTTANEVVLVEQYRFGVHDFSLEIPGGFIDQGEEPMATALRELREETGYCAAKARALGAVYPNPAMQNNQMHYFFAPGASLAGEQALDPAENIRVQLIPLADIPAAILNRRITHALTITAFMLLSLQLGNPLSGLELDLLSVTEP
ncbi:MAG TPA: NUDIX hydrolase [Oligoflexia bacterium]|nr:NUDIX hydrolase [Oligoflexia bacterium]